MKPVAESKSLILNFEKIENKIIHLKDDRVFNITGRLIGTNSRSYKKLISGFTIGIN